MPLRLRSRTAACLSLPYPDAQRGEHHGANCAAKTRRRNHVSGEFAGTMIILLRKTHDHDNEGMLTCFRPNGTRAWWKLSAYLGIHDLTHYVVENTLGFENAFYGLIASGWEQDWFGGKDPDTGTKRALPQRTIPQADQSEFIVLQLQAELLASGREEDFILMLAMSCAGIGCPVPAIAPDQLIQMRADVRRLVTQWHGLGAGDEMELYFAPVPCA